MTTNEPLTLIEKMMSFAEEIEQEAQAHGPNAYDIVDDVLERLQYSPRFSSYYHTVLDRAEKIVQDHCDTDNVDTLISCLEQLLDDMDDAEENENE